MLSDVAIEVLTPRLLAAVRRTAAPPEIARVFKPALDLVWSFLRRHPGLNDRGLNVFLYHHVAKPLDGLPIDFGVEVVREFVPDGEVRPVTTPAGRAAVIVHRGPYSGLPAAHEALHRWCEAHGHRIGGYSLEIYGHWTADEAKLETTIAYLLA